MTPFAEADARLGAMHGYEPAAHVCEGNRPIVLTINGQRVAVRECQTHPEHNVGMTMLERAAQVWLRIRADA